MRHGTLRNAGVEQPSLDRVLEWSERVGPLSGKTTVAVIVWLLAWGVLYLVYRNRPMETRRALVISLVLIGLGLIGTFPEFFQLFAPD